MRGLTVLMFCFLASSLGCSDSGISRQAISGTVVLDGQPLKEGSILLTPITPKGMTAGCKIEDGRYELNGDTGPTPGEYRVEISAWKSSDKPQLDEATGQMVADVVSIIPARYNSKSELTAKIESGATGSIDFDLKSGR
ncbi:hypothetical protein [Bremerella sp. P1]|uniref:hypothetical protein n=1 Tax=Bremerella sp. P1 TaxID=3026424 RepID=UPI002367536C|nr:hypothetical protein [Bremerella sp. P1]WDI41051.1 hypothetical protein PSR63_21520 [Bremerella sp. P1]